MAKPSKSDKRNQRAAAKKNAKAAVAVAAKNGDPPAPPPIVSAEPLGNNELCETCGLWGTVLCCDNASAFFTWDAHGLNWTSLLLVNGAVSSALHLAMKL